MTEKEGRTHPFGCSTHRHPEAGELTVRPYGIRIKVGNKMKSPIAGQRSEKGQSLVELAVSLVLILTLLAGVVDLGRLLFEYLAMRDAAQEAAAYATVYPSACNQTIERARVDLANNDPSQVSVTVLINGVECQNAAPSDACAAKPIKIIIHEPKFRMTMPFLGSLLGIQTIDLSATVNSAVIRPPCE